MMAYLIKHRVPTLYISADQDEYTSRLRAGAIVLQRPQEYVEALLASEAEVLVDEALQELDFLQFCFTPAPHGERIVMELAAYIEINGAAPEAVVIDNARNVYEGDDEWTGLVEVMDQCQYLGRETGAAIIALHHTLESQQTDTTKPAARHKTSGKILQGWELILSVASDPEVNEYYLAAVKCRLGRADPSAKRYATMYTDLASMSFWEDEAAYRLAQKMGEWT